MHWKKSGHRTALLAGKIVPYVKSNLIEQILMLQVMHNYWPLNCISILMKYYPVLKVLYMHKGLDILKICFCFHCGQLLLLSIILFSCLPNYKWCGIIILQLIIVTYIIHVVRLLCSSSLWYTSWNLYDFFFVFCLLTPLTPNSI